MRLTKKDKDLLIQMINFFDKNFNEIKNKLLVIKTQEEYLNSYRRITDQIETLQEEIKK